MAGKRKAPLQIKSGGVAKRSSVVPPKVEISVQGLGNTLCCCCADATMSTHEIKRMIMTKTGIPTKQQQLILDCTILQDSSMPLTSAQSEGSVSITLVRKTPMQMRWLELVRDNKESLEHAPKEIRDDKEIVIHAISKIDWEEICFASMQVRNDPSVGLAALKVSLYAWDYIAPMLRKNRELVVVALRGALRAKNEPQCLKCIQVLLDALDDFCKDQEIINNAIALNWRSLAIASKELRADFNIVSEAIRINARAIAFAGPELRANPELVIRAVQQDGCALQFVDPALRTSHRELILAAVNQTCEALAHSLCQDQKGCVCSDREILVAAIKRNGLLLSMASFELRCDKEVVLMAVRSNGLALQYAADDLRADKSIAMEAVINDPCALAFVLPPLIDDWELSRRSLIGDSDVARSDCTYAACEEASCSRGGVEMAVGATRYYVAGNWSNWMSFHALTRHEGKDLYSADIRIYMHQIKKHDLTMCFQIVENEDWNRRYIPGYNKESCVLGPCNIGHGRNWAGTITSSGTLRVTWNPSAARGLKYIFKPDTRKLPQLKNGFVRTYVWDENDSESEYSEDYSEYSDYGYQDY